MTQGLKGQHHPLNRHGSECNFIASGVETGRLFLVRLGLFQPTTTSDCYPEIPMQKSQKALVRLAILAAAALALSACNTFNGIGQDLRESGKAIQRAAGN